MLTADTGADGDGDKPGRWHGNWFFKVSPTLCYMEICLQPTSSCQKTEVTPEGMRTERRPPSQKLQSVVPDYTGYCGQETEWPKGITKPLPCCSSGMCLIRAMGHLTPSSPQRWGRFCCWQLHSDPGHAQTQSWASRGKSCNSLWSTGKLWSTPVNCFPTGTTMHRDISLLFWLFFF